MFVLCFICYGFCFVFSCDELCLFFCRSDKKTHQKEKQKMFFKIGPARPPALCQKSHCHKGNPGIRAWNLMLHFAFALQPTGLKKITQYYIVLYIFFSEGGGGKEKTR